MEVHDVVAHIKSEHVELGSDKFRRAHLRQS